eukprot:m.709152 g.709152  ORF g.709152 m.709152 type:complete len:899 (+) comp22941_c0_seq29:78-2774(+)
MWARTNISNGNRKMSNWIQLLFVAVLYGANIAIAAMDCPIQRQPRLVVLGGDDAGTGAAWAAAKLHVPTLLVLTHRRDLGGDPTFFYHDGAGMIPSGGGLNVLLLNESLRGEPFANARPGGPGDAFLFFDTLFRTAPLNQSLEILTDWIALPGSGVVNADGAVTGLSLLHRDGVTTCTLNCSYVIDGTPEGYGSAAFELPVVFGREAYNSTTTDPTLHNETYAGRRTFSIDGHGAPVETWSDRSVERVDTSSACGTITNICEYVSSEDAVPANASWLLATAPLGYRPSDFHGSTVTLHEPCCDAGPQCNPRVFRFEGLTYSVNFSANTGSTGPSLPRWYEISDDSTRSVQHYLRASYANASTLWAHKRAVELRAFAWPVGAMWYIQTTVEGGRKYGFCNTTFPTANPSLAAVGDGTLVQVPPGPYRLSDFGTRTQDGGDPTVCGRLYHRVTARLASLTQPVGAARLYGGAARVPNATHGDGQARQPGDRATRGGYGATKSATWTNVKTFWEPESITVPLYGTDYTKGTLGGTVARPSPNASGDGVLMGNGPSAGNMHGIHPRILFPDANATVAAVRAASASWYPPTGTFRRTMLYNYLSPGTPRSTFMLQSAARIGCFANALGVAAGTYVALAESLGLHNTSAVPTLAVQWTLAANLSTAVTYYDPPLNASLDNNGFAAMQVAGAYAVPPDLNGNARLQQSSVTLADMNSMLASYAAGVLNGTIPTPPAPPPPAECLGGTKWYAYDPDWQYHPTNLTARATPSFHCAQGALLKRCIARAHTLPPSEVRCFPPNATVPLMAPPVTSAYPGMHVVSIANATFGTEADADVATRRDLFAGLNTIWNHTAAGAMVPPTPTTAPLPVTMMDIAQVVVRHAAVIRQHQHGVNVLQLLGLHPYAF